MLKEIRRMGKEIDSLWNQKGREMGAFPGIAVQVLQSSKIFQKYDREGLVASIWRLKKLPKQLDLRWGFGHPPVTLYRKKDFVIDIYFWIDPFTAIHTHAFRGVFTVLEGKSLHYRYDFLSREDVGRGVFVGDLRLKEAALLHKGTIEKVIPGGEFIHQVAHITRPSVSLVIRTSSEKDLKQFTYHRPHLAYPSRWKLNETIHKKVLTLLMLHRLDDRAREELLEKLVLGMDAAEGLYTLTSYFNQTFDLPVIERTLEKIDPLRNWSQAILTTFREIKEINVRWPLIKDEGERFLASLLFAQVGRDEVERLTREYVPKRTVEEAVGEWLRGLSEENKIGLKLNESASEILALLVRGCTKEEVCRNLAKTYGMEITDSLRNDVDRSAAELEGIPLLKPLFPSGDRQAIAS